MSVLRYVRYDTMITIRYDMIRCDAIVSNTYDKRSLRHSRKVKTTCLSPSGISSFAYFIEKPKPEASYRYSERSRVKLAHRLASDRGQLVL